MKTHHRGRRVVRLSGLRLVVLLFQGCGASPPAAPEEVAAAEAPSEAPAPTAGSAVKTRPVPAKASYAGHGQGSVSEAVLARYPVDRLQPAVARRIEAMMDLVPPSTGAVSEDGKKLVFNWRVTGTPQVWTMDGPMRFPRQLTGGEDATSLVAILQSGEKGRDVPAR